MTTGRPTSALISNLRKEILTGSIPIGDLIPSVRHLSLEYKLATKTVHRTLIALEKEGLLVAEPRKGYRVIATSKDPRKGCPVAFILESTDFTNSAPLHFTLRNEMEKFLATKSFSILTIFTGNHSIEEIVEQIQLARVWGVLLDTVNIELLQRIKAMGIPAVMIDAWVEDAPFDVILQDNYQGGHQAGQYLINKGYKRIAWVGPIGATAISRERYGGAVSALAAGKKLLSPELTFECHQNQPDAAIRKLFAMPKKPDAILCLWSEIAVAVAKISKELGFKIGVDFDMVGWSTTDKQNQYAQAFENKKIPSTIVWSPEMMAQTAITRLSERWTNSKIAPMRLLVDTSFVKSQIDSTN
jgi:DNA-binding LacI/PurR family transcriptional regulator